MVTINQSIDEQPPDPSALLTLSVENLTFIRLLQLLPKRVMGLYLVLQTSNILGLSIRLPQYKCFEML